MATKTSVLDIILPKKRPSDKGISLDPTFNVNSPTTALAAPSYTDHRTDIFDSRASDDARTLLQSMFRNDPDVSATVNAYLTVASSAQPYWIVYDQNNAIDPTGHEQIQTILQAMFAKNDYSLGFQLKPDLTAYLNELRYMLLLRGGVGVEVILSKLMLPTELRHVDLSTLKWYEKTPGQLKPTQDVGSGAEINLDTPLFFVSFYKRDPTGVYAYSPFVSSINTIAARQQVINDLYRIMRKTGYPRQSIKVVEEVLRKNAPAEAQSDMNSMNVWMRARLDEIASSVTSLTADQVYVHFDSVEPGMLNEKTPAMEIDIQPIINVLNAQNQAALKTMATIIGRGESGTNTASVESRIFSMHADSLNQPLAQVMSDILTLCLRLTGSLSRVEFGFSKVELRPDLELEPQRVMQQTRLLELLSRGLISDDEFHIEMFNHPKPPEAPELSGTDFLTPDPIGDQASQTNASDSGKSQGNSVSRAAKTPGSGMAKSSQVSRKKAA